MQKLIINTMFDEANLLSTSLKLNTFSKEGWMNLAEILTAYNGMNTISYGTKSAFAKVTDTIGDRLYNTALGDSAIRTGYIQDVYGISGRILDQSLAGAGEFALSLPINKILLVPQASKLVTLFMEGDTDIVIDDGRSSSIKQRSYSVQTSYEAKFTSNSAYGVVYTA